MVDYADINIATTFKYMLYTFYMRCIGNGSCMIIVDIN